MATQCIGEKDNTESTFINFSKTLMKSFVLLTVVIMTISIKTRLIDEETTLFYSFLFIIAATVLFTIVGVVDSYVYSNLVLGIGLALGLQIMDWRKK
jgi:hypothetical protein